MQGRRSLKLFLLTTAIVVPAVVAAYGYYQKNYPYGWTHSCDKQLYFALVNYADAHDGEFPTGETTPEACLSLLHREPYFCNAQLLSGKNVETEVAEQILSKGELLGPDTCGWHYVPGLSLSNDPRLALFWDKPGLGHNGQRLYGGGHIVWFVTGDHRHISAAEWDSFAAEQKALREKRQASDM